MSYAASSDECHSPPAYGSTHTTPRSAKRNSDISTNNVLEDDIHRKSFKYANDGGTSGTPVPGSPINDHHNNSSPKRSGVKSSDFRGVSKCAKDGRWQSRIRVGKKVKYLGRFKTEIDAARKYDEAALALHGRRSTLNFEMSEQEVEYALLNAMAKRIELGLVESSSSSSREPSRSTSPTMHHHHGNFDDDDNEEEEQRDENGEDDQHQQLPVPIVQKMVSSMTTHEDQNAAVCLMWLKMNLSNELM